VILAVGRDTMPLDLPIPSMDMLEQAMTEYITVILALQSADDAGNNATILVQSVNKLRSSPLMANFT